MSKSGQTEQFTPVSGEQNEEVIKDYVTDCGDITSAYKLFTVILMTLLLTPLQFDERFKIQPESVLRLNTVCLCCTQQLLLCVFDPHNHLTGTGLFARFHFMIIALTLSHIPTYAYLP